MNTASYVVSVFHSAECLSAAISDRCEDTYVSLPTTYLPSKCSVLSQSHVIHLATGDAESVLNGDISVSNIDVA